MYEHCNPVVTCGRECYHILFRKRKAELLAEQTAEDIGTDDSERSSNGSDMAGLSTEEFITDDDEFDDENFMGIVRNIVAHEHEMEEGEINSD